MKMNISLPIEIEIPDYVVRAIRNKAISDFMSLVNKKAECGSLDMGSYHDVTPEIVSILEEIAEQLKAGEIND